MAHKHLYIQWKGTDLCGDFTCTCGAQGHIDDMFVSSIRCGSCERIWVLPTNIKLIGIEDVRPSEGQNIEYLRDFAKTPEMLPERETVIE